MLKILFNLAIVNMLHEKLELKISKKERNTFSKFTK